MIRGIYLITLLIVSFFVFINCSRITLIEASPILVQVNSSAQIFPKFKNSLNDEVTLNENQKKDLSFSIVNPLIASVDASGLVTGVSAGKTEIIIQFQGVTAIVEVVVLNSRN